MRILSAYTNVHSLRHYAWLFLVILVTRAELSVLGNSDVTELLKYGMAIIVKPHCIFGVANQSKSLV